MKVGMIKKSVAALVVSAAATVGISGAAFASKNDHRYQHSAEAHRNAELSCTESWNQFEKAVNDAHRADQKGQKGTRDAALSAADGAVASGQAAGCSWVSA